MNHPYLEKHKKKIAEVSARLGIPNDLGVFTK